jgi:23S rRNA (cytidine1920-2'-O)/16S rRNA (cytidine1409-2'-O)-methyltransferase
LDQQLVRLGLASSREKAKALIMAGLVEVDGIRVDKPGRPTPPSAPITLRELPPYVSRGGGKLSAALEGFSVDVEGKVFLDVGASTGGFTDCLLQHGARKVIAVDVGHGQLDWRLRNDPRVEVWERTNIRHLEPPQLNQPVHGAVIDVSFISLRLVIPAVSRLLIPHALIIALVKPQFEVGRGHVGKGGVVRDARLHREVVDSIRSFCSDLGWTVRGHIPSPVLGPKGNQEFLLYLSR